MSTTIKIDRKTKVVTMPLSEWESILDKLEDLEMYNSDSLRKEIAESRERNELYTPEEVEKILGIS